MQGVCIYRWYVAAVSRVTVRVSLFGRDWGCMFIVHSLTASFFLVQASLPYTWWQSCPRSDCVILDTLIVFVSEQTTAVHPTQWGHNRLWRYNDRCVWPFAVCYVTIRTHYDLGTLIPECNGLSQFNEDTGKPSVPVREFNLIACPPASSSWKTPFQTWIWTQAGKSSLPRYYTVSE